ncbi:MAG: hypothetical protein IJ814_05325 [Paludibacteraceae bacterium]|nr:hypothetical protein [Paludibacteraceae bacterium]
MKKIFIALVLGALIAFPRALGAEEVEIQLVEMAGVGLIEGDNPFDGPSQSGHAPTRPNDFRATIDGNILNITIEEPSITDAQLLRVYKQSTIVVDHSFSFGTTEILPSPGAYTLEIQTAGGMLVGNFNGQSYSKRFSKR